MLLSLRFYHTSPFLLRNSASIVIAIWQPTPLIALLRSLGECCRQQRSEVCGIHMNEPIWIAQIGLHNILRIDEEILSRARNAWIFVAERGDEDGGFAVVVEFPVHGSLWADCGLIETYFGIYGKIWETQLADMVSWSENMAYQSRLRVRNRSSDSCQQRV